MDYDTIVSIREDIAKLRDHIDRLYNLIQNVEHKCESLEISFENEIAHQESEERNHVS